jgi:hypothetical protein
MTASRSRKREVLVFAGVVIAAAVVILAVSVALRGPVDPPSTSGAETAASPAVSSAASSSAEPVAAATGEPQICASCWGDGGPDPTVKGEPVTEDGVQVVRVGVEGGYYTPNEFTVQAGVPVRVVFSGHAAGCLAEPEFPDLGVKGDFSNGSVTLDLGTLEPGSYPFTCSMGVNEGHLTAE